MNESIFGLIAQTRTPAAPPPPRVNKVPRSAPTNHPAVRIVPGSRPLPTAPSSPEPVAPTPPAQPASPSWSLSCDVALLAILEAPIGEGETVAAGFARKEGELRQILGTLSILESRAMHSRLSNPKAGDPLAKSFLRLTAERRARLINFLADARRRAALGI